MFYYNANPLWASPPPTLDFTAGGSLGTNFDRLTPALGQVFFIGDGMAQTGGREAVVQEFVAPANATHLYIGIADAQGFSGAPGWYDDNLGDFYVTVSRQLHPTYTIGGQITYAGPRTGAVYVDLLEETFTTGFVPRITATGTGPWIYSFANLDPGTGPGYLRAFMDVDGDGHPGADEPVGVYAGNPLAPLAADVPAADITLTDPPTGQVVITNMWPREGPVLGGNTPTAHVEQASVVAEGAAVDLRVTAALGAPPYHYAWKWVRGADQTTLGGDENPLAFQPGFDTVAHPLAEENTSVVCTVTDSAGRSVATATWNVVRIADTDRDASAPVICTTPDTPRTNDDLLIEVTTDATDPDGDAIAGYAFDWRRLNDNWTYGAATLPAEHTRKGEAWEARARAKTYPYGAADFYSLNAATLQVIIGNTTPAAVVPTNLAVKKNGELAVTLGAQDPDRDDGIDVLTYAIDAMPLHGQIEGFDGAAGTFTYRPNADYVGTDTLWYSVSDGTASSATARVDVLVYGGWLVDIAVQNAALGRVSFGVEEGAMDGLDEGVDELCPPPPPLDVGSICFLAVDQAGVLGLARDIRGQAGPRWLLEVAAADNPVGLSWEGQALPPGDLRIWETDAQGQRLPGGAALAMAATRTLEVPAGQTRYFAIGFAETFTLTLYRGWNLVSLPVDPIDPDVADVFNDHLGRDAEATLRDGDRGVIYSGSVYAWNTPGATGYVQVTTVRALQGYWVYAAVQVDLDVVGIPPGATQLALAAGWNLLGVPQDMDLPAGLPNLVLPVWQWNGSVYEVAGELTRGFGYWFYAREAALIPLTR
ncbi:MAG: hypothetical protein BWZ02_02394 [Lentisphaerae bacterium ADurb.BinA184]|nr:MAG: hypothetical protein BWZ02_02394 [Lentisphaerae bacterium ADurb.BinA184]